MKKLLAFAVWALSSALSAFAAEVDGEGMPVVYLRGDFNATDWAPVDTYRFTRNGNEYSLQISEANAIPAGARFKIATDEWMEVDFGGAYDGVDVDYTQSITLVRTGKNLSTNTGIHSGSISFTYSGHPDNLAVSFVVDGSVIPPVKGLSGTLPVIYINVYADADHTRFDNEVISKDLDHKNYFEFAEYWLDVNGCSWLEELGAKSVGSREEPLPLQIKARGNWTRKGFSKKPYKIKLDKKQGLLGLTKSKHFALLAHADDNKGYLRNFTGFNLGRRIGLPWTPWQQPVELVVNGDYRGLYFLTESIRVDEDRVNIAELKDGEETPSLVSGGYIVELDNYDEDDSSQLRMDEASCVPGHYLDRLRVTFDTPEVYSDLQRLFIREQFSAINRLVGANDDALWSYLDLDDAARYYLVEEIVSHTEAYHGSTYLFRDRGDGQKWHFSPLWDFGNAFNGSTSDFFYNCDPFGNTWIPSMRTNARFNEKVRLTWLWFMQNEYPGLEEDIAEYAGRIKAAAQADFARWDGQPVPRDGQPVADNRNMERRSAEVVDHLHSKISWLKEHFGDFNRGSYAEPERDATPAAELPSYVATVVDVVDGDFDGQEAEYFNLQGIRVANPARGVYIMRRGSSSRKVILP